jgi:hypothetical protein
MQVSAVSGVKPEVMPQIFMFDESLPSAEARPFKTREAQHAEKNAPQNQNRTDHTDHQMNVLDDLRHR